MLRYKQEMVGYLDDQGNFALPNYLYDTIKSLMKASLDYGTLLSSDPAKLRSYKEMTKNTFKDKWSEIAKVLEYYDIITPCTCDPRRFCEICGGSRFLTNENLSADRMRDVSFVLGAGQKADIIDQLAKGLEKALEDVSKLPNLPIYD